MAWRISCGKPERNEVAPLNRLAAELPDDWALFTNIPRHLTGAGRQGREIDALALSPRGAVVIELKKLGGLITVMPNGEWYVGGELLTDPHGNTQHPIQQAGRAAQVLKSALGAAAGRAYIESCAIATAESARIRFDDPARPQAILVMDDAVAGILALARTTRGVSHLSLQAFFALIGHQIPSKLDTLWREQASAQRSIPARSRGRHQGRAPTNYSRSDSPEKRGVSFGAVVIAVIIGTVLGGYLLGVIQI